MIRIFYGTPSIGWQYAMIVTALFTVATVDSFLNFVMGLI